MATLLMLIFSTAYLATSPITSAGLAGVLKTQGPLLFIVCETAVVLSSGIFSSLATGAMATPSELELGPRTISALSRVLKRLMSEIACVLSLAVSSIRTLRMFPPSMPLALTSSMPTSRPSRLGTPTHA